MPFMQPDKVVMKDDRLAAMEFHRTEQRDDGTWEEDTDQLIRLRADFVISAFGSALLDPVVISALAPLQLADTGFATVDKTTMTAVGVPWLFCGGDIAGVSETTVEATNDGKTASWAMHKYLQVWRPLPFFVFCRGCCYVSDMALEF